MWSLSVGSWFCETIHTWEGFWWSWLISFSFRGSINCGLVLCSSFNQKNTLFYFCFTYKKLWSKFLWKSQLANYFSYRSSSRMLVKIFIFLKYRMIKSGRLCICRSDSSHILKSLFFRFPYSELLAFQFHTSHSTIIDVLSMIWVISSFFFWPHELEIA